MKTPFYLITGFLGSGKTTFIKNLIEYFSDKKKIAIIQNEFAPANIDGKELKKTPGKNFDILEINNGSAFCVCLLSGFIKSLSHFLKTYQPDIIFMEASGLSDPIGIGEVLNSNELSNSVYLAGIFCIIDANNFLKLNIIQQNIKHQTAIADFIIINKQDLCDQTDEIKNIINTLNPHSKKVFTSFCKISFENIFITDENIASNNNNFFFIKSSGRPDIQSVVFRSLKPICAEKKELLVKSFNQDIIRLKGYILLSNNKSLHINKVYDELHTEITDGYGKTELIALGKNIDLKLIRLNYLKFCE